MGVGVGTGVGVGVGVGTGVGVGVGVETTGISLDRYDVRLMPKPATAMAVATMRTMKTTGTVFAILTRDWWCGIRVNPKSTYVLRKQIHEDASRAFFYRYIYIYFLWLHAHLCLI
jgi:hypothetical protein